MRSLAPHRVGDLMLFDSRQ